MASPAFQLHQFNSGYLHNLAQNTNPSLSRRSSLSDLLAITDRITLGMNPTQQQKRLIQEAVHLIPYESKQKYQKALQYLRDSLKISICARPCEPNMSFEALFVVPYAYNAQGQTVDLTQQALVHVFKLSWKSSDGFMQSLANVGTRESITFRTSPANPPFNYVQASIPMQFEQGGTSGANMGWCKDDHITKPPNLICTFPRVSGCCIAEQWYQFTDDGGATWTNIPGAAYLIERGVRDGFGGKVFYFKKMNWPLYNTKPFHFEAEYPIAAPPNPMPPMGVLMNKVFAGTEAANIYHHAVRVISLK